MKNIQGIYSASQKHWVGDGFPVKSLFTYSGLGKTLSPFLLLDYAEPTEFASATKPRGVGQHPHRGFETVTLVYQGELQHRDSTGSGGIIGPGDVQWMTAGSGILHEEFHSHAFTERGGVMEMVQLWVNLPAKEKSTPPGYQTILDKTIPIVELQNGSGKIRVIAGEFSGYRGPAKTFTPIHVWDLQISAGKNIMLHVPQGFTCVLINLRGTVLINDSQLIHASEFAVFERNNTEILLDTSTPATLLLLSGKPIEEPVVGYGPFVMNSQQEIDVALKDFHEGRFGKMHE